MEKVDYQLSRDQALERLFEEHQGYVSRELAIEHRIDPHLLSEWVRSGRAERVQRGLYRLTHASPFSHEQLVEVSYRAPQGVICLRSALVFHELGTGSPSAIDVAIPNKARRPKITYPPVNFFYFSETVYQYGVEGHRLGPVTVRVYSPEKTLADLLYFQNKIGTHIFLEALREYIRRPGANPVKIMDAAKVRRVSQQMYRYLEVLV